MKRNEDPGVGNKPRAAKIPRQRKTTKLTRIKIEGTKKLEDEREEKLALHERKTA